MVPSLRFGPILYLTNSTNSETTDPEKHMGENGKFIHKVTYIMSVR